MPWGRGWCATRPDAARGCRRVGRACVLRQHGGDQRRRAHHVRAAGFGGFAPRGHGGPHVPGGHAHDHRGEPRQHVHARGQPAEPVPVHGLWHGCGGVSAAHGAVYRRVGVRCLRLACTLCFRGGEMRGAGDVCRFASSGGFASDDTADNQAMQVPPARWTAPEGSAPDCRPARSANGASPASSSIESASLECYHRPFA